jgi:O-antigen/teichoic acid export membrane protein
MLARMKSVWTAQRRHAANFLSFIVLRLLALGAFALSVPIFINNASEAAYGVVAIGFSLLGVSTIFDVGIGFVVTQVVARRVARRGSAHPRAFNHLLWLYISGASLAAGLSLIAILLAPLTPREQFFYGCLVSLLPFLAVSGTATAVFQGHGDLVYLNASRFLFEIGKGIAVALSGLWFGDYPAVGPFLLACVVLRASVDIRVLRVRLGYRLAAPDGIVSRSALRLASHGAFSMGAAVLMVAVHILDKVLIANWLTKAEVAYYSIAFDVNTKAYLLVHALNSTMLTVLLHNYARRVESTRHMKFAVAVVFGVAACYYLPLAIWAEELVGLWVNREIASHVAPLVRVMAGASVLYLFGSVFETGLLARAAPRFVFFVTLAAVASYALALAWLPSRLGVVGFVWAYLLLCATHLVGMTAGHFRFSRASGS